MQTVAAFAALALLFQGTVYIPPGAVGPNQGGDLYVLGASSQKLYLAYTFPEVFKPGAVKAVTLVTLDRTPQVRPDGRRKERDDMGLIVNCAARTAQLYASALWDDQGLGIEVRGPVRGDHAITAGSPVALAADLVCQGRGTRAKDMFHEVVARWRAGGRP